MRQVGFLETMAGILLMGAMAFPEIMGEAIGTFIKAVIEAIN